MSILQVGLQHHILCSVSAKHLFAPGIIYLEKINTEMQGFKKIRGIFAYGTEKLPNDTVKYPAAELTGD